MRFGIEKAPLNGESSELNSSHVLVTCVWTKVVGQSHDTSPNGT